MLSTEFPINCTLSRSKSALRLANSMNSVVQTGVKSAGWENNITHLPFLLISLRRIMPWVVLASKSGAGSLMRGIRASDAVAAAAVLMTNLLKFLLVFQRRG